MTVAVFFLCSSQFSWREWSGSKPKDIGPCMANCHRAWWGEFEPAHGKAGPSKNSTPGVEYTLYRRTIVTAGSVVRICISFERKQVGKASLGKKKIERKNMGFVLLSHTGQGRSVKKFVAKFFQRAWLLPWLLLGQRQYWGRQWQSHRGSRAATASTTHTTDSPGSFFPCPLTIHTRQPSADILPQECWKQHVQSHSAGLYS